MQALAVSIVVAAAAGYAAWQFMPQRMRRWLVGRLMIVAPSHRSSLTRLAARAERGGCHGCKGCAADRQGAASPVQAKLNLKRDEEQRDRVESLDCVDPDTAARQHLDSRSTPPGTYRH